MDSLEILMRRVGVVAALVLVGVVALHLPENGVMERRSGQGNNPLDLGGWLRCHVERWRKGRRTNRSRTMMWVSMVTKMTARRRGIGGQGDGPGLQPAVGGWRRPRRKLWLCNEGKVPRVAACYPLQSRPLNQTMCGPSWLHTLSLWQPVP